MKTFRPNCRLLITLFFIVSSVIYNSLGATTILDTDTIDTDYTLFDDTIKIYSDVVVLENATLSIFQGTVIEFQGHYKLNIRGRLLASGTIEDRIIFTAKDTVAGWHGIRFLGIDNNSLALSHLQYCTIRHGNATGAAPDNRGGGIFTHSSSKLLIENCIIEKNRSEYYGGGIGLFSSSSAIIRNCIIRNNSALYGAGMHITLSSHPTIENCLFYENEGRGALFIEYNANPVLKNLTITNNDYYGIRTSNNAHPELINCIVWNNEDVEISNNAEISITHSDIEGGWTGEGNIDVDPLFLDPANSNYRLDERSLSINAGHPLYNNDSIYPLDLDGLSRVSHDTIDMGAYEFENLAPGYISFTGSSIYENELPGKFMGLLNAIDDAGGDSLIFSLPEGVADNASFAINVDSIFSAETFDYESKSEYIFHVRVCDNSRFPAYSEGDVLIKITNRNEAPTEMMISDTTIAEDIPVGSFVATLSTNDPDLDDPYTFSFIAGDGDTNNADFLIKDDTLLSNRIFTAGESLSIRIRSTNNADASTYLEKDFQFNVLDYTGTDRNVADKSGNISVFPNPMNDFTQIDLRDSKQLISDIYLYNFKGQIVESYHEINSSTYTLYRRNTHAGLYILKIVSGSDITYHKLMIQ